MLNRPNKQQCTNTAIDLFSCLTSTSFFKLMQFRINKERNKENNYFVLDNEFSLFQNSVSCTTDPMVATPKQR